MGGNAMITQFRKAARYVAIYGLRRTMTKVAGRLRIAPPRLLASGRRGSVGLIGCGQFGFSTIAYFLGGRSRIRAVYDVDGKAAVTLAKYYGIEMVCSTPGELLAEDGVDVIYIASNHSTHADYAVDALRSGKRVYVEKPIAVSVEQLRRLSAEVSRRGEGAVFVGYNRPYSRAVQDLVKLLGSPVGPITLNCFVSGHVIPSTHWYRRPAEGTRVCGNMGHWIDLAVHLLYRRSIPDKWKISVSWSSESVRDDDFAVTMTTDKNDLVNIVLTARAEPFEGINETINLQWDEVIAKIDDFRRMTVWRGKDLIRRRYWPKDVGHKNAVAQPFSGRCRDWTEVVDSTLLMLKIAEMVKRAEPVAELSLSELRGVLK